VKKKKEKKRKKKASKTVNEGSLISTLCVELVNQSYNKETWLLLLLLLLLVLNKLLNPVPVPGTGTINQESREPEMW